MLFSVSVTLYHINSAYTQLANIMSAVVDPKRGTGGGAG